MPKHAKIENPFRMKFPALAAAMALVMGAMVAAQATPQAIEVGSLSGDMSTTFVAIESATRTNDVVTFQTRSPHQYRSDDIISTEGLSPSGFNLPSASITVTGPSTFTVTSVGADVGLTAQASSAVSIKGLNFLAISQIAGNGSRVTFTTTTAHNLSVGDRVTVSTTTLATNGNSFSYTKTRVVAVPTGTSFEVSSTRATAAGATVSASGSVKLDSREFVENIVAVSGNGSQVTFTTDTPHGLLVGDRVNIKDLPAVLTSGNSFDYSEERVLSATTNTFAVSSTRRGAQITNVSGVGGIVTFTTSQPHGLTTGNSVSVDGLTVVPTNGGTFDRDRAVTVLTPTTFTIDSDRQGTFTVPNGLSSRDHSSRFQEGAMGLNLPVGGFVDYKDVFTSGATRVHARVSLVSESGLTGLAGTPNVVETLDYAESVVVENLFLSTYLELAPGGLSFAEFRVDFYTGTPANQVEVFLENLKASTYDIDIRQFAQFSNFSSFALSASSNLDVVPLGTEGTRFLDRTGDGVEGNDSFTISRVTVSFDRTSSFSYRIGRDRTGRSPSDSTGASYQLDLGSGWNVGNAWTNSISTTYSVVFNSNGGSGSMATQNSASAAALTANAFERSGFTFAGWSTTPSGEGGTPYVNSAQFPFTSSSILYAQWEQDEPVVLVAPPAPYSGPVLGRLDVSCLAAGATGTAKLIGERLNTITSATVDGKAITLSSGTSSAITLTLPALSAGTYDITFLSSSGSITFQDSLRVCGTSAPAAGLPVVTDGATKPFSVGKRFTNYRGDIGAVSSRDRRAITAFIRANPGLTEVTCVGSTSGRPALATDRALAMLRAKNACSIVERLVPGINTRSVTSVGRGVGQFFRAVTLTGRGIQPN